jgi:hypothetical protein
MTTETKEATCAERIASAMASEEENLRDIFRVIDGEIDTESEKSEDQQTEEAYQELWNYALGSNTHQETVITLSWGGPASYIEVTHDKAEIIQAVYRFSDWFDTATETLDEKSPLYRFAVDYINTQEGNC